MLDKNSIDDILSHLGYEKIEDSSINSGDKPKGTCRVDLSGGANKNFCRDVDLDIKNGFQDVDPLLFITVAELIGNVIASELPMNVTNAIANYLNLIGQIIETYASQLVYFENGPGRCFDKKYRNIGNPFLNNTVSEDIDGSENPNNVQVQIDDIRQNVTDISRAFLERLLQIERDIQGINNNQ